MLVERILKLPRLPGEKWWGGIINSPVRMPFPVGASIDLNDLRGNCGMPLLLSNKGRSIWSEEPFRFEIKARSVHVRSNDPQGVIEYRQSGDTLREAYLAAAQAHFPPAGRTPAALFFTAPQYNTWIEMTYFSTQARVLDYAENILRHGFPPGILMIDTLWHPTYGTWTFDAGRYPDPRGMVEQLKGMGFKVMLWVVPYVTADTLTYREIEEKGYLFKRADGQPVIIQWWDGYSAALDITNPQAVAWLHEQLGRLVNEIGVSGFKLDGGQPVNYARAGIANAHVVTHAWNQVGMRYELAEYKDLWKMAGQPVAQRIRDRNHSWHESDGLGSLVPMGLEQGLMGYTFNCPDMIGGGEYTDFPSEGGSAFDPELFVRYSQASALFPMMQFSAAPWRLLNQEHLELCLQMALLHQQMGENILEIAQELACTGEPIMRHLEYAFPGRGYHAVNDQFLLGDNILVTPVVTKDARSRKVIFPPGTWIGDDGSQVDGPVSLEIQVPLSRLPWYRRKTS